MNFYKALLIIFLSSHCSLSAQNNFELVIGGPGEETAGKVMIDDGQIVLAGHTTSSGFGSYDIYLVRLDSNGNFLGNTIVGAAGEDLAISAAKTNQHEYILTGYTNSFGYEQPFAVKFNRNGNMIWSMYYPLNGWGEDVAALPDGSFYITGYTGLMDVNVLLLKCDSSGNVIWSRSFGDTLLNEGRKVIASKDGGAIVCGITHVQAGGPTDFFVIKTDSSGRRLWSNSYQTSNFWNWDMGYAVYEAGEDILIGSLSYCQAFNSNPNSPDAVIAVLDNNGNIKKSFAFGENDYDDIRDISYIGKGKFCITGTTNYQTHGQTDMLFVIADTSGIIRSQKIFGGNSYETGLSINALDDNNFLIAGYTESLGQGLNDMYLVKTDSSTTSCNGLTGNVQSAIVNLTKQAIFDTISINTTAISASYAQTNQSIIHQVLCFTSNISENISENSISVFPNPFTNFIELQINNISDDAAITLYDIAGRKIKDLFSGRTANNNLTIDLNLEDLESGIYIIKMNSKNNSSIIKVVKQN